jgi:hypothetical protein
MPPHSARKRAAKSRHNLALHPTAYRFAAFAALRALRPLRCVVASLAAATWRHWARRGRSLWRGVRRRACNQTATTANKKTTCALHTGSTPALRRCVGISRRFFICSRCRGVEFQAGSTPATKQPGGARCCAAKQRGARRPPRDSAQRARGGGRAGRRARGAEGARGASVGHHVAQSKSRYRDAIAGKVGFIPLGQKPRSGIQARFARNVGGKT